MNADDFGLSSGVNDGILEAHAAGVVSSVSVLVNAPGWEHAVAALRGTESLGVGLHLNLTAGEPLSEGRTLVDAHTGRLAWRFHDGEYSPVIADRERLYLTGFTSLYGLAPTG